MHPNASQWVRMDPKASKSSRKPQKTCENFEKLRKNFEKLREKFYKNFFHGVVCLGDQIDGKAQAMGLLRRPLKGLIGNATTFCAEFR